jgi:hypothetical protein
MTARHVVPTLVTEPSTYQSFVGFLPASWASRASGRGLRLGLGACARQGWRPLGGGWAD